MSEPRKRRLLRQAMIGGTSAALFLSSQRALSAEEQAGDNAKRSDDDDARARKSAQIKREKNKTPKVFDDRLSSFDASGVSDSGRAARKDSFVLVKVNALEKPKLNEGLMNPGGVNPCACNAVCPCVPDERCACNAVCPCDAVNACSAYCACVGDCGCDGYVCGAHCPSFCGSYGMIYTPCG